MVTDDGEVIIGMANPRLCQSLKSLNRPRLARAAQGALSRGSVSSGCGSPVPLVTT